ncbi:hypothetical protein SGR_260 [Streptomyces griseus subsp. griseus NBRC 13350]|uniref:Uncharacterized protein n=1 Tax=Streptomyces griseus subsp. griseus (strain JCM 4626 / CBS 651.72 / NBRC 13350 / KCC S-0626 / ISP 5235) TaxID=455632 RepID=B1VNR6_STRGG|nr:hypothetical protein [Streptomyces griseus]BAG17089.1 hypothetical protein SGR_260 [Streptomyces griseus subsp. griseus NBRC 13350]
MRCREILAFCAGIAVLLLISVFTLGSSTQTPGTVDTSTHSHSVSVFDGSGPSAPLEGVDGDATLQHRHKAGSATASPPVPAGIPSTSPDLHDCAADAARQHAAHPGSRSPARVQILRC